ncbi:hypothetical protein NDU88_005045 [Pleurodeles waltl]|uniref:Uncharacterized protein n=1 Tax=Pleurodeles waltl TaxID=8319 RepID=A0AAV7RM65_PLEWA|nr:hypothetical protein NDU88_005045 [Pleurodeles waltl]
MCQADIGDTTQQYPGGIIGSGAGDPDVDTPTTNEKRHPAEGGVSKPTATLSRESTDSPGIDGTDAQNQQQSRAEETTQEPGRRRRQQHDNLFDTRWDEQEVAKRTNQPRSGKNVA